MPVENTSMTSLHRCADYNVKAMCVLEPNFTVHRQIKHSQTHLNNTHAVIDLK
jgi:hypothetical protein